MQQLTQCFWVVVLLTSVLGPADAKRGCAAYGHSCYGGHGKRSAPEPTAVLDCSDENVANNNIECQKSLLPIARKFHNLNKEIASPTSNQFGPNRYDIGQIVMEQRRLKFAIYDLIRQMVDNLRKARESFDSRTSDNQM